MHQLVRGLHHVTATVDEAQADLDFYAGALGQRLVKKTVNFDNHDVYHFYYGNEAGTPGTIMTTFPYRGMGVRVGSRGAGQITVTSFSVPTGALGFWRERLATRGLAFEDEHSAFGEETLRLTDPSGLAIRLIGNSRDPRAPWQRPDIGAEHAVRGIHGVSLLVADPAATVAFLVGMMDGAVIDTHGDVVRVGIGGGAPGQVVEVVRATDSARGVNGLGTVHHVAFAVSGDDEQLAMRRELVARGHQVTEVRDRQYFRSIYFREPGGVLFEIATMPPGFTFDEAIADLGRALKLPPWEEPNREAIEAALPAVRY